jgi:hypothetical protein
MMPEETHLASLGSPSSPVVVKLGEYKGKRFLDIRRYYLEKKSNELKPTKKGIALTTSNLELIKNLLSDCESEIEAWLSGSGSEAENTAQHTMAARADALSALSLRLPEYVVKKNPMHSPLLSRIHSEGQSATLELNSSHPFVLFVEGLVGASSTAKTSARAAEEVNAKPTALVVLHLMLLSFAQTRARFDDVPEVRPADLFAMFEYEWGKMLGNFAVELSE